ncbi:hypothetical protein BK648_07695 [Pseudomonas poae]|uniref:DAPG hydrolase PhiG domain-containing protein n=1 Tax=Pseudomonas poae TaxID=200451 RepID=A0A423FAT6_9PSED|nr:hypothetical protein [Pseudomonas poae]ROM53419.1 hypothetical protein BK648_07695 [Pseudomonas poae]
MFDRTPYETKLDPNRPSHLGLLREEHSVQNHSEFFVWDVVDWPAYVQPALDKGIQGNDVAMGMEELKDLLKPGYLPLETGYARCSDGKLSVAVLTPLPGGAAAMIDWWFGWHSSSTERYKLWHPQAHLFSQPRYILSDVPGLTDRERYVGNTLWVDEYIGPSVTPLAIEFQDPKSAGLSYEDLAASGHGTAAFAEVRNSSTDEHLAYLCHAIRKTDYGSEMRSRFVFRAGTPDDFGHNMLHHCATEMNHLASFLPRLYTKVVLENAASGALK